jgi:hypothetical protein
MDDNAIVKIADFGARADAAASASSLTSRACCTLHLSQFCWRVAGLTGQPCLDVLCCCWGVRPQAWHA